MKVALTRKWTPPLALLLFITARVATSLCSTSSSSDGIPPGPIMSTSLEPWVEPRQLPTNVEDLCSCTWGSKWKSWLSQLSNMPLGTRAVAAGGPLDFLLFAEASLSQMMSAELREVLRNKYYSYFWFCAAFLFWPRSMSTDGSWLQIFWISLRPARPCFCFLPPLPIFAPASPSSSSI